METPPSSRIITRSTRKFQETENGVMKSRSVLTDITNDLPIVGLAIGNFKTPSSTICKKRLVLRELKHECATTPGSVEALLRDQVKTLLAKVEEEAVISKVSFEPNFFVNSAMYLCPPTPANTPRFSEDYKNGLESLSVSPVVAGCFDFRQVLDKHEENDGTLEKHLITKLMFADFSEETEGNDSFLDDKDDESVWSVQVNASMCDELEDNEDFEAIYEDGDVDECCEVVSKICVNSGEEVSESDRRIVDDGEYEIEGDA